MSTKKHRVNLSESDHQTLTELLQKGVVSARKLTRARILLMSDEARASGRKTDVAIAELLSITPTTVKRVRARYQEGGLETALEEQPRSGRPVGISAATRAKVTALACTEAPEGRSQWSLRLLADKIVELAYIDTISYQSVREILKKTA